jgi:hypothetical protein
MSTRNEVGTKRPSRAGRKTDEAIGGTRAQIRRPVAASDTIMNRSLLFLPLLLATPSLASAQAIDRIEHQFGVSAVTAMSGNGGLTAGISQRGELTVLSWPSPSFHDQIDHQTAADVDARTLPRFGAEADRGVFAGLWIEPAVGEPYITWLRDPEWEHTQDYRTDTSPALVQSARLPGTGISVFETSFVDKNSDVLHRRATIQRDAESDIRSVRYLLYTNFAPQQDRPADLADIQAFPPPESDDDLHDFAAFWDGDALLHFSPTERDYRSLDTLMDGDWSAGWTDEGLASAQALAEGIDDGVFVALVGRTAPDGGQVGWDTSRPCPGGSSWSWRPGSAWDDAQDGFLDGSPLGACQADAVLAWDVEFGDPGVLSLVDVDQAIAVQGSAEQALALATGARTSFDEALASSEAAWDAWVGGLHVPSNLGDELEAFSRRTLIAIAQGTDRDRGAIVASVSRQPGYHLDWPRDSAFFDIALDVAGDFDAVSQHSRFLTEVQNHGPEFSDLEGQENRIVSPDGAWFMNFWADGQESTNFLNPFEIDHVGLMLWKLTAHAAYATNENARRDVLASAWPSIQRGADLLAACVADDHPALTDRVAEDGQPAWYPVWQDLSAGTVPDAAARQSALDSGDYASLLPCTANEDDNPITSVSLYSTHVTRMGLLAAADAARVLCVDEPRVAYWEARAHELAAVALKLYYDADSGAWDGRGDWLLWPTPLWVDDAHADLFGGVEATEDFVEQALQDYASSIHDEVDDAVELRTDGAAYENKKTLNLARFWTGDRRPDAELWVENLEHLERLAVDFALPGTHHVGEVFVSLDTDNDGVNDTTEQRVATPHLWAATLSYLTAMAIAQPERFDVLEYGTMDPVCPVGEEPLLARRAIGCDCLRDTSSDNFDTSGCNVGTREGGGLLLLLAMAFRRRRR